MASVLRVDIGHRLSRLDLRVELDVGNETLAVVGPSGAGKSTVLRAIAGLVRPNHGRISCAGRTWFDGEGGIVVPPEGRSVGMVFQEGALFPHMTVARNVAYGLRRRDRSRLHRRDRPRGVDAVPEVLERFGIAHLADARPASLSPATPSWPR